MMTDKIVSVLWIMQIHLYKYKQIDMIDMIWHVCTCFSIDIQTSAEALNA